MTYLNNSHGCTLEDIKSGYNVTDYYGVDHNGLPNFLDSREQSEPSDPFDGYACDNCDSSFDEWWRVKQHLEEPCQHIDFRDTLDGHVCNDCGLRNELED